MPPPNLAVEQSDDLNRAIATAVANRPQGAAQPARTVQPTGAVSAAPATEQFAVPQQTSDQLRSGLDTRALISSAVSRRQMIESGVDPDAPALYPSRQRQRGGGPSRWEQLQQEHRELGSDIEHYSLLEARQNHESYIQNRNAAAAQQFSGMVNEMEQLTSPIGSKEHAKDVLAIAAKYPVGAMSTAGRELLQRHSTMHDSTAELLDQIHQAYPELKLKPSHIGPGGVSWTVDKPTDEPAGADKRRYSRLQASIEQHKTQAAAEAQTNRKAGQENVPYSQSAEWAGDQAELKALEQQYPSLRPAPPAGKEAAPTATPPSSDKEVTRMTKDNRKAVFDSETKKFLRYAE
jgi:hypothetical protein